MIPVFHNLVHTFSLEHSKCHSVFPRINVLAKRYTYYGHQKRYAPAVAGTFITELLVKYLHILNMAVDKELFLYAFIFGMFIKNFSTALKENNADAFSPYFITSRGCETVFKFRKRHLEVYITETTVLSATCRPMGVILSLITKLLDSTGFLRHFMRDIYCSQKFLWYIYKVLFLTHFVSCLAS